MTTKRNNQMKNSRQWKPAPFECNKCGSESEVLTKSKKDCYYYDEEEVRCANSGCDQTGNIIVHDDECVDVVWDEQVKKEESQIITLEYFNGTEWTTVGQFFNEISAWISLGLDRRNYRTVDLNGNVISEGTLLDDLNF